VEIDLKASAARRALMPSKEGKRSKKQRALEEAAALLEAERRRQPPQIGAGRGRGGGLDPSSLLLRVEGQDDAPTAAALAVAGVEGADAYVTVGGQRNDEGDAAVLRGGLLHLLPSERERCVLCAFESCSLSLLQSLNLPLYQKNGRLTLDGLVPLEDGEREVDLVRSRLPKGILVPELQVRC
jgi:hypothetical protein